MKLHVRFSASLFVLVLALTGCKGAGGASRLVPSGTQSIAQGSATFTIAIPLGVGGVPAMQSLSVSLAAVNGAAPALTVPTVKMNVSRSAPGCLPTAGATLTCTAKIAVPPGSDTFSVLTYAQPNQTGNQVSNSRVTTVISAGHTTACVKKASGSGTTAKSPAARI